MKRLPNLFPLRFFLSVCVLIYHLPLICKTLKMPFYNKLPIFDKGVLSVYYFFTLSGFLIIRLIYVEIKKTNNFSFKDFYLRRVQRLYPVYYLVLVIGVLLYYVLLPLVGIMYKGDSSVVKLIFNYVFFIPNIYKYYHPQTGSILIVLWSIGIEEQFYLFIPAILYLLKKSIIKGMVILLIILIMILFFYPSFYQYDNYYFYFLGGGLIASITSTKKIAFFNKRWLHLLVYLLFILSFFTNLFYFNNLFIFHSFNLVISCLLISLISDHPVFIVKSKILDHLGKISYGIYMYHMIIITGVLFLVNKFKFYNNLNGVSFIIMLNLVVIASTIVIAHLSYVYFENRFYKPHVKLKS